MPGVKEGVGIERSECGCKRTTGGILVVMEMLYNQTVSMLLSSCDIVLAFCKMVPFGITSKRDKGISYLATACESTITANLKVT